MKDIHLSTLVQISNIWEISCSNIGPVLRQWKSFHHWEFVYAMFYHVILLNDVQNDCTLCYVYLLPKVQSSVPQTYCLEFFFLLNINLEKFTGYLRSSLQCPICWVCACHGIMSPSTCAGSELQWHKLKMLARFLMTFPVLRDTEWKLWLLSKESPPCWLYRPH